jgi:hypothetical protein
VRDATGAEAPLAPVAPTVSLPGAVGGSEIRVSAQRCHSAALAAATPPMPRCQGCGKSLLSTGSPLAYAGATAHHHPRRGGQRPAARPVPRAAGHFSRPQGLKCIIPRSLMPRMCRHQRAGNCACRSLRPPHRLPTAASSVLTLGVAATGRFSTSRRSGPARGRCLQGARPSLWATHLG